MFQLSVWLFVLSILWAIKGIRFALCILPAILLFLIGEVLIWNLLTPDQYPGDFLDMFLPLVTVPIGLFFSILLLLITIFVAQITLAFVKQRLGPQGSLPILSQARLPGLFLAALAVGMIGMGVWLEKKSLAEYEEQTKQVVPHFFSGTIDGKELKQLFIERPMLCRKPYTEQIDGLLETDPQRAGLFLKVMTDICGSMEAHVDFVNSRKMDGSIKGLDTLLGIGFLDDQKNSDKLVFYLTTENNQDELMRIFAHYHALARSSDRQTASGVLGNFIRIAGFNKDVLTKIRVVAGNDPKLYLSDFEIDGISHALLSNAALNLDPDLMRASLALGFEKENTRFGSVLYAFTSYRGGLAVIRKLLEKGVDVTAQATGLLCTDQRFFL